MDRLSQLLSSMDGSAGEDSLGTLLLSLLTAFVLGQLVAWVYTWTHSGLSYSRTFTQSILLLAIIVTLVMFVIGNSLITAFGLMGAMAIIRFRNVLKDTRDMAFVFFTLLLGMATGTQRFATAYAGTVAFLLVALYLHYTSFGSFGRFDGHLRLRLSTPSREHDLRRLLSSFCGMVKTVSIREESDEDPVEYVFQIRLRDRSRRNELMRNLHSFKGVTDLSISLRDELAEV